MIKTELVILEIDDLYKHSRDKKLEDIDIFDVKDVEIIREASYVALIIPNDMRIKFLKMRHGRFGII